VFIESTPGSTATELTVTDPTACEMFMGG